MVVQCTRPYSIFQCGFFRINFTGENFNKKLSDIVYESSLLSWWMFFLQEKNHLHWIISYPSYLSLQQLFFLWLLSFFLLPLFSFFVFLLLPFFLLLRLPHHRESVSNEKKYEVHPFVYSTVLTATGSMVNL